MFKYTIDGVNWFAHLLHEAEIGYYAELYSTASAWKDVHARFVNRDKRDVILRHYKVDNDIPYVEIRPRPRTEGELQAYQMQVTEALHAFLDNENARIYLPLNIEWNYPEKNSWRWLEINVLPDGSSPLQKLPTPKFQIPTKPTFSDMLRFEVLESTIEVSGHTEYIIKIVTELESWYPITSTCVLRRFNDFKSFYGELNKYTEENNIDIGIPEIPEGSFIGRYEKYLRLLIAL